MRRARWGERGAVAASLALALGLGAPAAARQTAGASTVAPTPVSTSAEAVGDDQAVEEAAGSARFDRSRHRWSRCAPGTEPCVRPRPARVLLLGLGALSGLAAAGILFVLGDRAAPSDPGTLLVGGGAVAGVGALVGMVAGRLDHDGPALPDRVRVATADLAYTAGFPANVDEREPHNLRFRLAPQWTFRDPEGYERGRVRLVAHGGGWLLSKRAVDPRPQVQADIDGQDGTAPIVHRQRRTDLGIGLDWAVRLPYPVMSPSRSSFLGPAEIRWKPDVQIRRDIFDLGLDTQRVVERTMLLPLTVGMRWIVSPRQRFTFYAGPRFDFVSFSEPGSNDLKRGGAQLGPLYGEAWWDLDVALTGRPRRDGESRRIEANGMLTLGYTHSRFDGNGFNFGPVIGFLGPFRAAWRTKIRPLGADFAFLGGVSAAIGNGAAVTLEAGVVTPDLNRLVKGRRSKRRARARAGAPAGSGAGAGAGTFGSTVHGGSR